MVCIIEKIGHLILKMVAVESSSISSEIPTINKINQVHDFNLRLRVIILHFRIQIMCRCRKIQFPLTLESKIPNSDKGKIIDKMTIQIEMAKNKN